MALMSGNEIARQVGLGNLVIQPYDPTHLNPNSYNLRLSSELLVYKKNLPLHEWHERRERWTAPRRTWARDMWDPEDAPGPPRPPHLEPLDMAAEEATAALKIPAGEGLDLWPGVLYLGATMEYTETRGFAPKIDGRSSVGRLGKMIHVTAGFGDDNFCGDWTLEIVVVAPLRVYPGVPVCQIAYSTIEGERLPYAGQYQGQRGPKPSTLWRAVRKMLGRV